MKTRIVILLLLVFTAFLSCRRSNEFIYDDGGGDEAERLGRPVLRNNSIYTAWGTKIRGTSFGAFLYSREQVKDFPRPKDYERLMTGGINTLQIKLEWPGGEYEAGAYVQTCDRVIDECERLGLYVILCIGAMTGFEENYDNEVQWMKEFWTFYAPRYKDRKHVIFELCNEFGHYNSYGDGFEACIEGQASLYRTVRQYAPETPVILWSFSHTLWKWDFPVWMRALEDHIPGGTHNVAVGIHSYECGVDGEPLSFFDHWGAEGLRSVVHLFNGLGYPVINTEMPYGETSLFVDAPMFRVLEEDGIAWIGGHFDILDLPSHWRGEFEAAGIAWTPDYGDWPRPDAHYPFAASGAGGITLFDGASTLARQNFGTREPMYFTAKAETESSGRLEIRLTDGTVVGACPVTEGIDSVKVPIIKPLRGVPDVELEFIADVAGNGLRLRNWRFELPPVASYENPYRTVYFANYPYRSGIIERGYNTDPASDAPFLVRRITHGSRLSFDKVWLNNPAPRRLHIRARVLAGGAINVWSGRPIDNPYEWSYQIGYLEINGANGEWKEFVIPVNIDDQILNDMRWDLNFDFVSPEGNSNTLLFELSEFIFK